MCDEEMRLTPLVCWSRQHSVQSTLRVFDLLLQSLLHGPILRLPQHFLHVLDGGAVARRVVEHANGLVPAAHQEAPVDVEAHVRDLAAVHAAQLLLQLPGVGVVHGHVAAVADGDHAAVRRERRQAALRGAAADGAQQVRVLLLLVLHVRVPQLPRAVLGHAHHPGGETRRSHVTVPQGGRDEHYKYRQMSGVTD